MPLLDAPVPLLVPAGNVQGANECFPTHALLARA